jgi:hypothetical protein
MPTCHPSICAPPHKPLIGKGVVVSCSLAFNEPLSLGVHIAFVACSRMRTPDLQGFPTLAGCATSFTRMRAL